MPDTITVDAEHIPALRVALYSCLGNSADVLYGSFTRPEYQRTSLVHTAYLEVANLACLLDRIGWQDHDQQQPLAITTETDARVVVEALTVELDTEEDLGISRERAGEPADPETKANQAQALHDALSTIGADAAAAGLLDAKAADDACR